MADIIQISGNFDGGNPKYPKSIIQTGPNSFTIIPYSEDNDPNYKFRLDVQVKNNSEETRKLHLSIDWEEPQFNHLRNYIYAKHKEEVDWTLYPMTVENTGTWGDIDVKPGVTHLCMHPKYNYKDYLDFINSISESAGIQKIKIGETAENRELYMIKISTGNSKPQKKILIVSRIHPYETAGSYCIEGIINHFLHNRSPLTNNHSPFTFPLSPFTFNLLPFTVYLIPMANPDGVYNGLCKLSAPDGIDLSKQFSNRDSTSRLIREAIDKIKPNIYCEFHNWMLHKNDGIYFLNWLKAKRFIRNLHSKKLFNKNWKIHLRRKVMSVKPHGFKKYCRERFCSICLCLEFPWRDRNIADMKRIGIDSLIALTKI